LPTILAGDRRDRALVSGATLAVAESPAVEPERPKLQDQFFKYLGIALKHRWLILACCLSGLFIGLMVTFTATPIYRATASIKIDLEAARVVKLDTVQGSEGSGDPDAARFYQTQYELLKSRSLAERVASNLDLRDDGFANPRPSSSWARLLRMIFPDKPGAKLDLAQRKAAAASLIQGGLSVVQAPNSSIVRISFDNPDPVWAQTIANAVAQGFTNFNLERRYGSSAYARKFLEEKLAELKVKLEDSEKALVAYADKEQIITSKGKDQQPLADSDLVSLNNALQQVRTERIRAQEQWEQASKTKDLVVLPQLLNDKSIQVLREKRALLVSDYQEKLAMFKPDYPDMRRLKAQIGQFDTEIERAMTLIKGSLKAHYESLRQQEELLQNSIDEARGKVSTARNKNIQMQILQRDADSTRTLYDGLLQQYKDIGVSSATGANNVTVIDRAQVPGAPYSPNLLKNLQLWFMLGLVGAGLAVAGLEIWDDTFKSPEDIEDQLGLTVLGLIPKSKADVFEALRTSPVSGISEAYRSLRTALQFSTSSGLPKSLVITSPNPGEGKSTTSVALAMNFAQLGMKVLLIDADLRNPSAHRLLNREAESGLTNLLVGSASAQDVLQATDVSNLMFMAAGPVPPNPAELLAGHNMTRLLSTASENFDVVIVDAPPVLGLADAPLLTSIAASTLLVLGAGETRRGVVKAALKRLHFARAQLIGVVLNKFDMQAASYAYHSYGYGLDYYGSGTKSLAKTTAS
jgi:capsular exopolysaccharide synthesis family protein